jgi:RNA polymerase nonessential primary-like sigma factor
VIIGIEGVSKPARVWSRERGLGNSMVNNRLRAGWHPHAAVLGERGEEKNAAHARLGLVPTVHHPVQKLMVTFDGVTRNAADWERERGLSRQTISGRLSSGWHVKAATLGNFGEGSAAAHKRLGVEPVRAAVKSKSLITITIGDETLTAGQWSKRLGMARNAVSARIRKYGWHPEAAAQAGADERREEAHVRLGLTPLTSKKERAPRQEKAVIAQKKYEAKVFAMTEPRARLLRHSVMTPAHERATFALYARVRAKYGDTHRKTIRLRNVLVQRNMKLVERYARSYLTDIDDRAGDGVEGLIVAINRFDVTRGFRFNTYASWWIRHYIRRSFDDTARSLVRVPIHKQDKLRFKYQQHDGVKLTSPRARSFDACAPGCEDSGSTWHDRMADERAPDATAVMLERASTKLLKRAGRAMLSDREKFILRYRFGLGGVDPQALDEIGVKLGVTRERVRQIQEQGLAKLRLALGSKEAFL